jgi:hypothetical protein
MVSVLVSLVESENVEIARAAVVCIGQSLPNGATKYLSRLSNTH